MKASDHIQSVSIFSLCGVLCLWLAFPALADNPGNTNKGGTKKQEEAAAPTRPKVPEKYIEQARKNRSFADIVSLHDDIRGYYDELKPLKAIADPREARKAERTIERLESKIERESRKLEKLVERKRKPYEKTYEENKKKVEDNTDKAKALEAQGKADKATRWHQEAAKYSGPMAGAKRQVDILNWFLFFDEEDK